MFLLYLWMKQSGDVNSIFDSVNLTSSISCGSPLHMMALLKLHVCIGKKGPLKIWTVNIPPSHGNYMDFTDVNWRSLVFTSLILPPFKIALTIWSMLVVSDIFVPPIGNFLIQVSSPIFWGIPAQTTRHFQHGGSFDLSPYGQPSHIVAIRPCLIF